MVDKLIDCGNIVGSLTKHATGVDDARGSTRPMIVFMNVDGKRFVIKMVTYETHMIEYNIPPPAGAKYMPAPDAEIAILRKLREQVIRKGLTPCIVELLSTKICDGAFGQAAAWSEEPVERRTTRTIENRLIHKLTAEYDMFKRGVVQDKVAFIAIEHLDATLLNYMRILRDDGIGKLIIQSIIWQLIYTIGVLRATFPGFKHNDLHLSNIMIYTDWNYDLNDGIKYIEYSVGKKRYYVPFLGTLPKIIDFGHASLPSAGIVSVYTGLAYFAHNAVQDDLQHLFTTIYRTIHTDSYASPSTRYLIALINALSPQVYHSKLLQVNPPEPLDAFELLDNDMFKEYRSPKSADQIYSRYGIGGDN